MQNPVDLDYASMRHALRFLQAMADRNSGLSSVLRKFSVVRRGLLIALPISLLLDFAIAFPSVSNAWGLFLLSLSGQPEGLLDATPTLYRPSRAFLKTKNA